MLFDLERIRCPWLETKTFGKEKLFRLVILECIVTFVKSFIRETK